MDEIIFVKNYINWNCRNIPITKTCEGRNMLYIQELNLRIIIRLTEKFHYIQCGIKTVVNKK